MGCGYYSYTQTPLDLARNAAPTMTRQVVIDQPIPTVGGIAVPATISRWTRAASFATSATDNLDLVSTDYTLTYASTPAGAPVAACRSVRTVPALGVAFDNVLTTASSFSLAVPFFIRNVATTTAGDAPQNNGVPADADCGSASRRCWQRQRCRARRRSTRRQRSADQPSRTSRLLRPARTRVATMISFQVANAAANISNCPAAGCAGNAAPANATTVTLTATATGTKAPTFQFINPFTAGAVLLLRLRCTNEWILIGTAVAPVVTDNAAMTSARSPGRWARRSIRRLHSARAHAQA